MPSAAFAAPARLAPAEVMKKHTAAKTAVVKTEIRTMGIKAFLRNGAAVRKPRFSLNARD
jgi:hypothetical protein